MLTARAQKGAEARLRKGLAPMRPVSQSTCMSDTSSTRKIMYA